LRLEDYDLRVFARSEPLGARAGPFSAAFERSRVLVAPHELREAVKAKLEVEYMKPTLVMQTCHLCGVVGNYDTHRRLEQTCTACGASWDAHHNAAMNLLRGRTMRTGRLP
jgi:transposase